MAVAYNSLIVTDGLVFSVDPANLKSYDSRENLITYSEQIDNAAWVKSAGGVASAPAVTTNAGGAPDGTQTAERVVFALNGGTTSTDLSQLSSSSVSIVSGSTYTSSVWIRTADGTSKVFTLVDVSGIGQTITVTSTWQRFSTTGLSSTTGGSTLRLRLRGNESTADSATVFVWGAQVETGSVVSEYIQTVASTVTRATTITDNASRLTGTLYNTPPLALSNGNVVLSYTAASSQYISVPYTSILTPTSGLTVAAWGWRSAWSNSLDGRLVAKTEGGGWHLGVGTTSSPTVINFTVHVNGAYIDATYAMSNLTAGWHYIVGVCDGTIARLFVDGVQVATGTPASPGPLTYVNNNNMLIGAESGGGSPNSVAGGYFTGYIGPVQVYNRALTLMEVKENFSAHRGRFGI